MTDSPADQQAKPFAEPGSATIDDFERVDMRVGRVVAAEPFPQARPEQRLALLRRLDAEQQAETDARDAALTARAPAAPPPDDVPVHYFRLMKELALLGYFTSEIGYRQAMRYVETPGRYDPCAQYKPGEKSWAAHA